MNRRNQYKGEKAKAVLDVCRGAQVCRPHSRNREAHRQLIINFRQVIFGCIILALSISLSVRWDNLSHGCAGSSTKECDKVNSGVGGLKYCIAVGVYALFDTLIWAADAFWISLPWWVIYGSAQMTGGLALGGGCVC